MSISKKKQRGFSMIEVLVSLIVIGVGMLGMTSLQMASFKGSNNAHSRNVASMLVMDLTDRMRANPSGVDGGFYINNVNCTKRETRCTSKTEYCSPNTVARFDVQEIMCGIYRNRKREGGIANLLPSGNLQIEQNVGCNGISDSRKLRISIAWSDAKLDVDQADADVDQNIQICVNP